MQSTKSTGIPFYSKMLYCSIFFVFLAEIFCTLNSIHANSETFPYRKITDNGIIAEENVAVKVRDGIILRGNVFRPNTSDRCPALLVRTPYSKGILENGVKRFQRYVQAGYAVMIQDIRGRYTSEGDFVVFHSDHTLDGPDGYDTVEWLAEQPYCNGQVGVFGASYNAWLSWKTAEENPPHLKALGAYSIPLESWQLDYPGSFKHGRRVNWWLANITPNLLKRRNLPGHHNKVDARFIWNTVEFGQWVYFMPWIDLPEYLPPELQGPVENFLRNPAHDYWHFKENHKNITVPNLDFSGWYDNCLSIDHLTVMQKTGKTENARTQSKIILGPWNHGGFGQRKIGEVDFGPEAEIDVHGKIIQWFDYWLKDRDTGVRQEPSIRYYVINAQQWKAADTWPPEGMAEDIYYLDSRQNANSMKRAGCLQQTFARDLSMDEYTYDPRRPVPTLWGIGMRSVPSDRRILEYREDICYYLSPPLEEEVEIAGDPEVVLYASSSAPDTDFFARLIDDDPDGIALEISYGMVRARHRHSLKQEDLIIPGEVYEYRIQLHATACRFLKGHRIRLEITSSDFPRFDRNHNTGRNDLMDTELVPAQQQIYHSEQYPSRLVLPVNKSRK